MKAQATCGFEIQFAALILFAAGLFLAFASRATDHMGRTSTTEPGTVIADRNIKVGHLALSFNDLTIPVAGIPIQVIRTYDSRDKRVGDFGAGWTLDLKNIRLQKNRHLGRAWDPSSTGGLFPTYCIDTRASE